MLIRQKNTPNSTARFLHAFEWTVALDNLGSRLHIFIVSK
jgi:hypothetical protein